MSFSYLFSHVTVWLLMLTTQKLTMHHFLYTRQVHNQRWRRPEQTFMYYIIKGHRFYFFLKKIPSHSNLQCFPLSECTVSTLWQHNNICLTCCCPSVECTLQYRAQWWPLTPRTRSPCAAYWDNPGMHGVIFHTFYIPGRILLDQPGNPSERTRPVPSALELTSRTHASLRQVAGVRQGRTGN